MLIVNKPGKYQLKLIRLFFMAEFEKGDIILNEYAKTATL